MAKGDKGNGRTPGSETKAAKGSPSHQAKKGASAVRPTVKAPKPSGSASASSGGSSAKAATAPQVILQKVHSAAGTVPQVLEDAFHSPDAYSGDSVKLAEKVLASLIAPVSLSEFFSVFWEKKPLVIRRSRPNYYSQLFSKDTMMDIFRSHEVQFTTNVDVTLYQVDGGRETVSPEGRVFVPILEDFLSDGCSVRFLNPHTYDDRVWNLLARLQEAFGAGTGANVYLTPSSSQGFAPHYDNIDAFVLQVEGTKQWRLHPPRPTDESHPLTSSRDMSPQELDAPYMTVDLNPGDLLYMPRGAIHQAATLDGKHSLHITVSTCQNWSWASLFQKAFPQLVEQAATSSALLRQSVVSSFINGHSLNASEASPLEAALQSLYSNIRVSKLGQFSRRDYILDCFPPCLSDFEKAHTVFMTSPEQIGLASHVKFVRRNIAAVYESTEGSGSELLLYHSAQNARLFRGNEPIQYVLPNKANLVFEHLAQTYPQFCRVDALPFIGKSEDGVDMRIEVVQSMFSAGILFLKK